MKKFRGFRIILSVIILSAVLLGNIAAYAANDTDTAANYLVQHGIIKGGTNGNPNLDKGLTRAELAVILTRLDFADAPDEWTDWGEVKFSSSKHRYNTFTDIPAWALPYIEYCYQRSLMKGTAATQFSPQGNVTPKMACTVMLRFCGVADTDWNYDTSVKKAQSIGIAPADGMNGDVILRGTMAVMIYRSIQYAESGAVPSDQTEAAPAPSTSVTPSPDEATAMTIEEMKAEIVQLTNIERVKAGLSELKILPELTDCAQLKAQDFLDSNYFAHTSPVYGTAAEMIRRLVPSAKGIGENIALGTSTPIETVEAWMASQGHRENILEARFTHIGVGIVQSENGRYWWVQQFIST